MASLIVFGIITIVGGWLLVSFSPYIFAWLLDNPIIFAIVIIIAIVDIIVRIKAIKDDGFGIINGIDVVAVLILLIFVIPPVIKLDNMCETDIAYEALANSVGIRMVILASPCVGYLTLRGIFGGIIKFL